MNFLVRRVQNYLAANGLDIYDEDPSNYFRYNDFTNEFYLWTPVVPQPNVGQLVIDYPDTVIAQEIALRQLRAYRNVMLFDTDKFITVDFPLTQEVKDELIAWRQALRDIPGSISSNLLVLNQYGRLDLTGVFPSPPVTDALLKLKKKFKFLA